MNEQHTIRITIESTPDPDRYAAAVLGCQAVLSITGLAAVATVWHDPTVVTDEHLGAVVDQWADHNPWA